MNRLEAERQLKRKILDEIKGLAEEVDSQLDILGSLEVMPIKQHVDLLAAVELLKEEVWKARVEASKEYVAMKETSK